MQLSGQVYNLKSLLAVVKRLRKEQPETRIVFTNGVFDILHAGHVTYLKKARALGSYLIVGMNSDSSVRRLKGPTRPIQKQGDRATILCALRSVDAVILFGDQTPLRLIKSIKPDILVKGADYSLSQIVGAAEVLAYGGKVKRIPMLTGRSTTHIALKMK
jgi:D-beta-D-heptose 7-phosphate kinase/D-beta-D-heptose 1-phosphate adenosyltransferase